jgi:hypothetical protein
MAVPRRDRTSRTLGYALGSGFEPNVLLTVKLWVKARNEGRSPRETSVLTARHSHRLTSGGKAEPDSRSLLRSANSPLIGNP